MARTEQSATGTPGERVHESYVLDVEIVECTPDGADGPRYRFEAPDHEPVVFEDPEMARLYADVYFDVNGFVEAGTGERGIPPELVQGGKDTLAAYLLTLRGTDRNWVASFFGAKPGRVERYVTQVRRRGTEIRERLAERGHE